MDVGVEQRRAAAAAAEAQAIALREVTEALQRQAATADVVNNEMREQVQASQIAAREATEHATAMRAEATAAEQLQTALGKTASQTTFVSAAQGHLGSSFRASQFAMVQTGQQLNDIVVSLISGQRASTVLAQQLPQLAYSAQGFGGKIGAAATTLSGPWSLAVAAAGAGIGFLISSLFDAGDAANEFKDAQDILGKFLDSTTGKINAQITATQLLAEAQRQQKTIAQDQAKIDRARFNISTAARIATTPQIDPQSGVQIPLSISANSAEAIRKLQAAFDGGGSADQFAQGLQKLAAKNKDVAGLAKSILGLADSVNGAEQTIAKSKALKAFLEGKATSQQRALLGINDPGQLRNLVDAASATDQYSASIARLKQEKDNLDAAYRTGGLQGGDDEYVRRAAGIEKQINQLTAARSKERREARGAAREAITAANVQSTAETKLAKIIQQNTRQPTRVERANIDNLDIDKLEKDLIRHKQMTGEIRDEIVEARQAIQDNLLEPYIDYVEQQRQGIAIGELVAKGRDVEAGALSDIFRLQQQVGTLTRDQVEQVLLLAQAQERVSNAIEDQRRLIGIYTGAVQDARNTFESFLNDLSRKPEEALKNLGKGLISNFQNMQNKLISNQLFGGLERDIEKLVNGENGIESANDFLKRQIDTSSKSLADFVTSLERTIERINGTAGIAANDNGLSATTLSSMGLSSNFIAMARSSLVDEKGNVKQSAEGDIVVTAAKDFSDIIGLAGKKLVDQLGLGRQVNEKIWDEVGKKAVEQIENMLGTGAGSLGGLGGVIGGGIAGYGQAGEVGAVLGAMKGIKGLPDKLDSIFGKTGTLTGMIGGAQTGTMAAGMMKALGIKTSKTGAQVGGAVGSLLPIPGGEIIGSIAGGLIGGLFKKAKEGAAGVNVDAFGNVSASNVATNHSNKKMNSAALAAGSSLGDGLSRIAEMLGGTVVGGGGLTLGVRDGQYRVDTLGKGNTKKSTGGVMDFDEDAEAAVAYALKLAVERGAVAGLRAGTQSLLKGGSDIETQLEKAIKFENVFKELKRQTDPVGAALSELNTEFEGLKKVFQEAGASAEEYSQLEQLYALERKQAVETATASMTSTLKSLMQDLTTNNDAFSLKDRLSSAMAEYNPLASRVASGDKTVDYDAFADAARNVLDIQRQLSGSQDDYFAKLAEVTNLTAKALQDQENVVSIANAQSTPYDVKQPINSQPVNSSQPVVGAIGDLLGMTRDQLSTLNLTNTRILATLQQQPTPVERVPRYGF